MTGTPGAAQDTPLRLPRSEPTDLQTCVPQPRRHGRVLGGGGPIWQEVACPRHRALAVVPLFSVPPYSAGTDGAGELTFLALLFGIALSLAAIIGVAAYWRWRKSRAPLADSDVQVPNMFPSGVREHTATAPPSAEPASEEERRRRASLAHHA